MTVDESPDTPACVCCGHRRTDDRVCTPCRTTIGTQLTYLLAAHRQLPVAQIPVKGGGEKVRTSKSAPLPLRLDPLSLGADGAPDTDVPETFIPKMRVWTEPRVVPLLTVVDGERVYVDTEVDVTHRERYLIPAGDQAGQPSITAWASAWVADWRAEFGHSKPSPKPLKLRPAAPQPEPRVGAGWVRTDSARSLLTQYLAAIREAGQREIVRDVLGLDTHLPPSGEPDPVAREWAHRYGEAHDILQLVANVRYLTTWLDEACEKHPDITLFAATLRSLDHALKSVLGDRDDKVWLGRCPVGHRHEGHVFGRELRDRETGEPVVCGAPLWREPFASIVACPRCGHETVERDLLNLSGWVRVAWPVDKRRRYPVDEVDEIQWATAGKRFGGEVGQPDLRMPCCDDCGRPIGVEWKECTERADVDTLPDGKRVPRRMWRIVRTFCPWPGCGQNRLAS